MKKLIILAVFLISATISAQQKKVQANQDTVQRQTQNQVPQQSVRSTGTEVRKAITTEDVKAKSEAEFQATKRAKDKGSTQKQTTAEQPVSDTVKGVKEINPQLQHDKPAY